jgi:hypothetical protein
MPGFMHAIWAIDIRIPDGTDPGHWVFGRPDGGLGVYVK